MQHTGPLSLSIPDILVRLEACKKECAFYKKHGHRFHRKHLNMQLRIAKEQDDEVSFHKISSIIHWEHQQNFWEETKLRDQEKWTRSATSIQVEGHGGSIMEHTTQESVERTIFSKVHEKHYTLAGEAPICNGDLFQDFGYCANTLASRAVLDGTYVALQPWMKQPETYLQRLQLSAA